MGAIALYLWTKNTLLDDSPMWVRYNFYVKFTQHRDILLGKRFGGNE